MSKHTCTRFCLVIYLAETSEKVLFLSRWPVSRLVKILSRSTASPCARWHRSERQNTIRSSVDKLRDCVGSDSRRTHLNGVWTDCKMTANCIHLFHADREGLVRGWSAADARIRDTDTIHRATLPSVAVRGLAPRTYHRGTPDQRWWWSTDKSLNRPRIAEFSSRGFN